MSIAVWCTMMTQRPWPPLYRHQLPAPFNEMILRESDHHHRLSKSSAAAAVAFYENHQLQQQHHHPHRYGMALCKEYPPPNHPAAANCCFVAAPLYRSSFGPPAVACIPAGRMLARQQAVFFETPPAPPLQMQASALERLHYRLGKGSPPASGAAERCRCSCLSNLVRSRSLENLCPSDTTTNTTSSATTDDRELLLRRRRKLGKENFKRRSMENLLEHGRQYRRKVGGNSRGFMVMEIFCSVYCWWDWIFLWQSIVGVSTGRIFSVGILSFTAYYVCMVYLHL